MTSASRRFTRSEARRLIPRLTELLLEIQERKREHDRLQAEVEQFERKMSSNGHMMEEQLTEAKHKVAEAAAQINGLIELIQEMGCEVKGIDQGLVDFRSEMNGREVYLCWKLGEPDIAWWHDLDAGFAGRQPLPEIEDE